MMIYHSRKTFSKQGDLIRYNQNMTKQIHKMKNRKQIALIRAFGAILIGNLITWLPITVHAIILATVDFEKISLG